MLDEFKVRRRLVVDGLNDAAGRELRRAGRRLLRVPEHHRDRLRARELQNRLLEEEGVAMLAGTAFGEYGEGYMRVSYANSRENLSAALDKVGTFLENNV